MIPRHLLSGLILAGGRARRMQQIGVAARDKGMVDLLGEPLVAHASHFLAPQVGRLFISANNHTEFYAGYGRVVGDDAQYGPSGGPLAGVASTLAVLTTPWLAVVPVDVPVLPADLLPELARAALASASKIAYAATTEQVHPLCMLLHKDALAALRARLLAGERKVRLWHQAVGAAAVNFDAQAMMFMNINTQEDLCTARMRMTRDKTGRDKTGCDKTTRDRI
jgi:molybdopterin-guanine dinucleotide biosynthesis protein A